MSFALPAFAAEPVIIDTDIGDDIDDAFAVSWAITSPKLDVLGITTAWGDTGLRAREVDRLLAAAGRSDIPVAAGRPTQDAVPFTQAKFAQGGPVKSHEAAVDFLTRMAAARPGQITLIELAPESNLAALGPGVLRQFKRVVLMGGSIARGYANPPPAAPKGPDAEYNIYSDVRAVRTLLASGVPVVVLPLDSTEIPLGEPQRSALFAHGSGLSDALTLLYHQWRFLNSWHQDTPTLFDVVPVAYVIDPNQCPTVKLRLAVDDKGFTRVQPGAPNADVCLNGAQDRIAQVMVQALLQH